MTSVSKIISISNFNILLECVWDKWSDWQQCSKSCGYGYQSRTRPRAYIEENGERKRCDGKTKEKRGCNKQNCDGSGSQFSKNVF